MRMYIPRPVKEAFYQSNGEQIEEQEIKIENGPNIKIKKQDFEKHEKTKELTESAISVLKKAINIPDLDIDTKSKQRKLIMIGGTSKMTFLQIKIQQEFKDWNVISRYQNDDSDSSSDHQLMVVQGAAFIGASTTFYSRHSDPYICDNPDIAEITEAIPLALGVAVCNRSYVDDPDCKERRMRVFVNKNSGYPISVTGGFCQHNPEDTVTSLRLYEGDSTNPKENYFLGQLEVKNLPTRDIPQCDTHTYMVEFSIDDSGIATIKASINEKYNVETDDFVKEIAVATNRASLSEDEIKIQRDQVIKWIYDTELREFVTKLPLEHVTKKTKHASSMEKTEL